jgi:hypothetical protein
MAATALAIVVCAAVAIARRAEPMAPAGDTAVIENYTLRAEHGALLVGPYSRFQWHHPGPMYFYALAPFYDASGNRTTGLFAGAFALNLLSLAILGWILATMADPIFAIVIVAATVVYVLRIPDVMTSAWNPHVVVLPTMALAATAAAAAAGRLWLLPVATLLASFVIQTHIGLLPVALVLSLGSMAIAGSSALRQESAGYFWCAGAASLGVLALAWFLPVVEQTRHNPGNFTELWRFFVSGKTIGQPLRAAFAVWSDMLAGVLRPDFYLAHGWVFKRSRSAWSQAWALVQLVALIGVAVGAGTRRDRFRRSMACLLLAAAIVALWSVTRVEGDLMDHEVFWISALGVLNAAFVIDAVVLELLRFKPSIDALGFTLAYGVLFGVVAALGLYQLQEAAARSAGPSAETIAIAQVSSDVRAYLQTQGIERPLVKVDQATWGLAAGVLLQLQKAGVSYAVDDDWLPMFVGAARTGREQVAVSIAGAERHYLLRGQPGTAPIAERDPVFADAVTP